MILQFLIQMCECWVVALLTKIKNLETASISEGINYELWMCWFNWMNMPHRQEMDSDLW